MYAVCCPGKAFIEAGLLAEQPGARRVYGQPLPQHIYKAARAQRQAEGGCLYELEVSCGFVWPSSQRDTAGKRDGRSVTGGHSAVCRRRRQARPGECRRSDGGGGATEVDSRGQGEGDEGRSGWVVEGALGGGEMRLMTQAADRTFLFVRPVLQSTSSRQRYFGSSQICLGNGLAATSHLLSPAAAALTNRIASRLHDTACCVRATPPPPPEFSPARACCCHRSPLPCASRRRAEAAARRALRSSRQPAPGSRSCMQTLSQKALAN